MSDTEQSLTAKLLHN